MDPSAEGTLSALGEARWLLAEAASETDALRREITALADATAWQARATDAYRAGIGELTGDLSRLRLRVELVDADLNAAAASIRQRAAAFAGER